MSALELLQMYDRRASGSERAITGEAHTIGEDEANAVWLQEVPLTGGVTVSGTPAGGGSFTEVSATPGAGEYRVLYQGRGQGKIEFNAADNGIDVTCDYSGRGSSVKARDFNRLHGAVEIVSGVVVGVTTRGDPSTRATRATAVQAAIDYAVAHGKASVYVPEPFFNYDAAAVTFTDSVKMLRQGGGWASYDVIAYGAVGDGTTNDAPAAQSAIDAAGSASGRSGVFFPATSSNNYAVETPLQVTKAMYVRGDNRNTIIKGVGLSAGQYVIDVDGTVAPNLENVVVENLTLMSDDGVPHLLKLNRVANSEFNNLGFRDAVDGITYTGNRTFSNTFRRLYHVTSLTGMMIDVDGCSGGGHSFYDCSFGGDYGFRARGANNSLDSINFYGCNFEACATAGAYFDHTAGVVRNVNFFGGRCEKNLGFASLRFLPSGTGELIGLNIHGMFFETDSETFAIDIDGDTNNFSIIGNYAADYGTALIRFNGAGDHGLVTANECKDCDIANTQRDEKIAIFNNRVSGTGTTPGPEFALVGGNVVGLTAEDASAVNSGDATTDAVIENLRTRLGELEAAQQGLGLLG